MSGRRGNGIHGKEVLNNGSIKHGRRVDRRDVFRPYVVRNGVVPVLRGSGG